MSKSIFLRINLVISYHNVQGMEPSAVSALLIGTSFQSGFKFADAVAKADPK